MKTFQHHMPRQLQWLFFSSACKYCYWTWRRGSLIQGWSSFQFQITSFYLHIFSVVVFSSISRHPSRKYLDSWNTTLDVSCEERKQPKTRQYVQQVANIGGCCMSWDDCFACHMKQKTLQIFWTTCEWFQRDSWLGNHKLTLSFIWLKGFDIVLSR